MLSRTAIVAVAITTFAAGGTDWAIAGDDSVYLSLRNQIGLLHYCQEQGFLAENIVASAQKRLVKVINAMPPVSDTARGDVLEQAGAAGKWGQSGIAAEQRASMFGLSVNDQCAEWAQ